VLKLVDIGIYTGYKHKHNNAYFRGFYKKIGFVQYTYTRRPQKYSRNKRAHNLRQMHVRRCKPENFSKQKYQRQRQ